MLTVPREVDASALEPEVERSPGIHLSQVLKRILVGWDPQRFKGGMPDSARLLQGYAWEEIVGQALARMAKKKPFSMIEQFEVVTTMADREIFCTLDAFDYDGWKVQEYKATWMSSRHPITDRRFWHWFAQLKAYCRVTETRKAELWAFFVNGNYKNGPELKVWEVEFSVQEIAENWLMLENCLKEMIRTGEVK